MTIRTKALLIIGVSLILMGGLIYAASRFTFMRGLQEIEARQTNQNVERVLAALSYLISDLETDTADWASWDDTYAFIEDVNGEYIKSNLTDETFITLRLNVMLFVHHSGRIVFSKAFDLEREQEIPTSPDLLRQLSDNSPLLSRPGTYSFTSGIILLKEGPVLITSKPILTSENKGPVRGTLIFARYLNAETINYLSQVTLFPITVRPLDNVVYPDFKEALQPLLQGEPILVKPLNDQYISGYTLLKDVYGKSVLVLRVDVPRDTSRLGQVVISYYIILILGFGMLVSGIVMFLVQTQILSRFTILIRGVNQIATTGDTSAHISLSGKDELNLVASTINGMLASLEESTIELREREERYRDLFENTTDLIQNVTVDGRFVYVNDAWRKTLGYSEAELASLSLWDIIHPDSMADSKETFQKIISGEPVGNIETVFITKDGESITVEGNASCQFEGGKVVAAREIFRDITERKQAEERLQLLYEHERDLRQQLEEEIQKRVEYTRALVHELKTPITPVLAASELLLEEIKEERLLKLVQSIDRSASNLNRRIDELLDLARGEVDMLELNLESVDPVLLLQEIGSEMVPVALRNEQTLTVELPPSIPAVSADSQRLRQVVLNLLTNALKFTPAGGKITLRAREDGANLIVEIQDTGPGISKKDQEKLFDPYFRRIEDRERLSGLGLGLALAKRLVELHQGQIWVTSQRGKGSTFGFSLPFEATSQKEGRTKLKGES